MFGEEKNLKDIQGNVKDTSSMPAPYQTESFDSGSYTKTNKLIIALYMVTDIIDKDEPLRNKLRTLGTGIISDINSIPSNASPKISELMSFLDIASALNIISEMNCSILRKEFLELDKSIKESRHNKPINKHINLAEFFRDSSSPLGRTEEGFFNSPHPGPLLEKERGNIVSKGHTRIGVQKGSTLMKALSDKNLSDIRRPNFDILKKQRRLEIVNIIKIIGGSATIKDIKDKVQEITNKANPLVSCGEKTLQRELVSMVKDGVLKKAGEKRWSRYFIK